eukprot:5867849-Prymnesium_polylepis.1
MTVRSPEQWRPPAGMPFVERLSVLSFLQHSESLFTHGMSLVAVTHRVHGRAAHSCCSALA